MMISAKRLAVNNMIIGIAFIMLFGFMHITGVDIDRLHDFILFRDPFLFTGIVVFALSLNSYLYLCRSSQK